MVSEVPTVSNGDVKKIDDTHMDVTIKLKSGLKWSDGSPDHQGPVMINAICDPAPARPPRADTARWRPWRTRATPSRCGTSSRHTGKRCGNSSSLTSGIYASPTRHGSRPCPGTS
jgi:hypothetical protein